MAIDFTKIDKWALGKHFDHSVLPKDTNEDDIRRGCREAVRYNCSSFYSASPYWTPIVIEELKGSDVLPATGIDYPYGASPGKIKALETEYAVKAGCKSVDIVINVGALRDKRYDVCKQELADFKAAAAGVITKVILDTAFLTDEEIAAECNLIAEVGCDYAKTATGQYEGPSMSQFLVMKKALEGTPVKLKVAGIKFPRPQNAYAFLLAGAEIIGTRAAVEIIESLDQMREIGLLPPYKG